MTQKKLTALTGRAQTQPKTSLNHIGVPDFANIVPVIVTQISGRDSNVVSAIALHSALDIGRDFSTWFADRVEEYGFVRGVDYFTEDDITAAWLMNDQYSPFSGRNKGRGLPQKDYFPNIATAKELAMVERNERGRAVRRYFIRCEEEMSRSAPEIAAQLRQQLRARITAANLYKPMCAALDAARAEQGKETQGHHYSTESNMIAKMALGGLTARQWAQINGVKGDPRGSMNADQLEHLAYLESTNITLIEMGMDYYKRKAELLRLSLRWLAKRVEGAE